MTRRTMIASLTILVLLTLLGWLVPSAAASTTTTDIHTFAPIADAFVSAATPRKNYGKSRRMHADVDPIMRSFMRFNVQNLRGSIVSASLWVYVVRGSGTGYRIREVASNHWGERTITYANRPGATGPARASRRLRSGSWTAVDVSSLIADEGLVSFTLATRSSSSVTIRSREARRKRPRLIVKTERDVQPPTAPTNLVATAQTATSISVSWNESTDDVGTVGYRIYVSTSEVGTATAPSYTVSSLNCGTMYALGVEAYDSANNVSEKVTLNASTEDCPNEPSPQSSCTYYVDNVIGNNANSGTSETSPWKSLFKVTSTTLSPGQTVCFARDSVWTGEQLFIDESGTGDAPITLTEYGTGANPPTFDGGSLSSYITFIRGSHVVWDGITGRAAAAVVEVQGDYVSIRDSIFTLNGRAVTTLESAHFFRFTNNTCANNNRMLVNTVGGTDDYGANCVVLVGDHAEFDHNRCYGNDAFSHDYGRDGSCVEIFGGSHGRFYANHAWDNLVFTEMGKPSTDTTCTDNRFWNNVIRGTSPYPQAVQFVIHIGGTWGPCTYTVIEANSMALLNSVRGIWLGGETAGGASALIVRNNVIRSYNGTAIGYLTHAGGSVLDAYNHFYGGSVAWEFGTGSAIADPRFVSATDLHLQGGSPSIDSGTNLGYTADIEGNPIARDGNCDGAVQSDRGAYEYQNGGC